jgi:ABC-type lipoprotein export system ATPase subunit/ABC-type antimicrobial peptide transport system permease subunit
MLQLVDVRKAYKTAGFEQVALDGVNLAFRDNEFVSILGPSGSGKTTMLNIIGGLDHYDSGDLIIDGISTSQYKDRDWDTYRNNRIGFVFQSYNLIPHQTVLANVELALTLSGISKTERRERARVALEEVGLGDHINKKPNQLSGGQMQRVAIARALINNPEIVLADEPTGALDSKVSVQIMALLTEIAQSRLVVMVTHNPELAEEYSNRIVTLHDGALQSDTNPFIPTEADLPKEEKKTRKTAMGFLTAVALSFTNLLTKKGRTLMTAFAGSIGIIGIAAILALANGVNNYIKTVEEETLSLYPLTIQSSGMDLTSMLGGMMGASGAGSGEETDQEKKIREIKMVTNTFTSIGQNDLAALKAYLDENGGDINSYVSAIEYSYNVTPQIFLSDTSKKVTQVNPDMLTSAMGMGGSGGIGSMMSLGISTNLFNPLVENTDLLAGQYDVVAGRWPEEYNECVVVLTGNGNISDYLLYSMGLRDISELEAMLAQFQRQEDVTSPEDIKAFSYDELLAVEFKLVPATEFYTYDETYALWTDRKSDKEYVKGLVDKGETLKVVGILQPSPDASATSLSSGIYYPASLTMHMMDLAANTQIVADQLANPEVNVFTGKTFEEEEESGGLAGFSMDDMMTVDQNAISNAFQMDTSKLNVDFSSALDPALLAGSMPPPPSISLTDLAGQLTIELPAEAVQEVSVTILTEYIAWAFTQGIITPEDLINAFPAYLAAHQEEIAAYVDTVVDLDGLMDEVEGTINAYMQKLLASYMTAAMANMQQAIAQSMGSAMNQFAANMAGAMSIDTDAFMNAFQFNLDEDELSRVMMAMMTGESNTYDNNLRKLGYASANKPSGISIYPHDFESKQEVLNVLDAYNAQMEAEEKEDQVITYTDIVGVLMRSVTTIVDMISYVLVAFVAISLVVSSIMIGVITYISVLERKKEIGILRAMGARKRDIGNVFNAETLLVGFIAGAMGIGITELLTIPANIIVEANFDVANIAILPWAPALILVLVSMGLTFIAGLIPSSAASRRDPVEALRSE